MLFMPEVCKDMHDHTFGNEAQRECKQVRPCLSAPFTSHAVGDKDKMTSTRAGSFLSLHASRRRRLFY